MQKNPQTNHLGLKKLGSLMEIKSTYKHDHNVRFYLNSNLKLGKSYFRNTTFTISFKFTWYLGGGIKQIVFNTFIEENYKIIQSKKIPVYAYKSSIS